MQNITKDLSREILQYGIGGLLYMPATNTHIIESVVQHKIPYLQSICLCLEDAIGDDSVEAAQNCLKTILEHFQSLSDLPLIFIRVRSPKQLITLYHLLGSELLSIVTGFNLPKFDSHNCEEYLEMFFFFFVKISSPLYFNPIIESKDVIYRQNRMDQLLYLHNHLAPVSDKILNIRVGSTDFCNFFGIRRDVSHTVYDMKVISDCLSDIVNVFSKNYVVSGPVWEYFDSQGNLGPWSEGLKKELSLDRINGFIGKTCIHPSQLPFVHHALQVSQEEYEDAVSILGMSDGLIGVQKSNANNKMNEIKTHTKWAKKIIGLYDVYGIRTDKENMPC